MPPRRSTGIATLLLDLGCIAAALIAAGHFSTGHIPTIAYADSARLALYLATWTVMAERLGAYLVPFHRSPAVVVRAALETWGITAAIGGLVDLSVFETPSEFVWRTVLLGALLLTIQRLLLVRSPLAVAAARP